MGGKIHLKTCEHCGHRYRFRWWDGLTRMYLCRNCGASIGKQEKASKQGLSYELWFRELRRVAAEKFNFGIVALESMDPRDYRQFYDLNYTPEEAIIEDMSNA